VAHLVAKSLPEVTTARIHDAGAWQRR
jgi:hypothetical protein